MNTTTLIDVRMALRSMRRRPGFALTSVLVLAIGIGAVTVMFSALRAVVLQPLPFEDPARLVWAWSTTETGRVNSVAAVDYYDYQDQCGAFESLAAHLVWRPGRILTGSGEPERVVSTKVSGNLFQTLGIRPLHGRSFVAEEEVNGGREVVVLSHPLWQRRFGGDPSVIGTAVTIDGAPREVVGVMPEGFDYPSGVELWFPMKRGGHDEAGRGNNNFFVIGRLADGVTLEQAQAEVSAAAATIARTFPDAKADWGMRLVPLHERFFGSLRPLMLMLMGATALVLLIACANLSSLFLAKVMSRRGELAVRRSMGASMAAVLRLLLVESLVISVCGAAAGVGLAYAGIRILKAFGPSDLPRLQTIGVDASVVVVVVAVTLLTALLFGLAPAMQGARVNLVSTLRQARHTTEAAPGLKMRSTLVTGQVALSLVLLTGAGLLLRSSLSLQHVDPGLDADGVLTVDVQLPAAAYEAQEARERIFADALERLRAVPGVADAAGADELPLFGGYWNGVYRADRPADNPSDRLPATRRTVTEGLFRTLGIPILVGREFEPSDRLGSPPVTVVSRALVDQLYPGEDPLGKILMLPWGDGIPLEIVGVAGDVRDYGLAADYRPVFYLPFRQYPQSTLRLVVRAHGEPTELVPSVRHTIRELDKDAPLYNIGTMSGWLEQSLAGSEFTAFLFMCFAAAALLLAATGLYGVMAYIVAERVREIGIRMAIGAGPIDVMTWVLRQGAVMTGIGLTAGLVLALALARLMRTMLFGTAPTDPTTYIAVSAILMLVAILACLVPALRAVRSDPTSALRS